jgi:hypothetical protein
MDSACVVVAVRMETVDIQGGGARMSEYHNEWYHKNKDRLREARRQRNRDDYRERKKFIRESKLKAGGCCVCRLPCTTANHVAFDWDHIDPSTKSFNLGNVRTQSFAHIELEISKCRLVCKNCHAIISYECSHWSNNREVMV